MNFTLPEGPRNQELGISVTVLFFFFFFFRWAVHIARRLLSHISTKTKDAKYDPNYIVETNACAAEHCCQAIMSGCLSCVARLIFCLLSNSVETIRTIYCSIQTQSCGDNIFFYVFFPLPGPQLLFFTTCYHYSNFLHPSSAIH